MKASDLREKSVEDLRELRTSLAHDTFQNRLKNFTNRLDDTSAIRKTKRDVARVITLLRERELAAEPATVTEADAPRATQVAAFPQATVVASSPDAGEAVAPKKKKTKITEAKQP
jgi:large subunit ribosomal protein L29